MKTASLHTVANDSDGKVWCITHSCFYELCEKKISIEREYEEKTKRYIDLKKKIYMVITGELADGDGNVFCSYAENLAAKIMKAIY